MDPVLLGGEPPASAGIGQGRRRLARDASCLGQAPPPPWFKSNQPEKRPRRRKFLRAPFRMVTAPIAMAAAMHAVGLCRLGPAHVDFPRRALPAARLRSGGGRDPVAVVLDGRAVGVVMPPAR
jgi:anti-sigma factor RsiW